MTISLSDPRADIILDIIARETGTDRAALLPEATLEALGIPSLDLTQAVFEIEARFDIEVPVVPDRAGAEFDTIGGLVAHVLATLDKAQLGKAQSDKTQPGKAGVGAAATAGGVGA